MTQRQISVVVLGGGPGGYEAALVAAALGGSVTVVDRDGVGGAAVLTDCVPSKALISTAAYVGHVEEARDMGVHLAPEVERRTTDSAALVADMAEINDRVVALAGAQSRDIQNRLEQVGVRVIKGTGTLLDSSTVEARTSDGQVETLNAEMILLATGATPRVLPTAQPDGERILTWKQIFNLREVPRKMIVVGSGVTGAELAQAFLGLGAHVVLVSSRDRVLPGEDPDAAQLIEDVFRRRGMEVLNRSRASAVERTEDGVVVTLEDGRTIEGSHALIAVGSIPATDNLGLEQAGVELSPSGHIVVDRVSRTTARGVYAAGDCTGVLPLASVAATQGRIAVAHALGDAVAPLQVRGVSANIFTDPEIATVGTAQQGGDQPEGVHTVMMPFATNARAKMDNLTDGFVKLHARNGSGVLVGGVVVAPRASELIFPIALAVQQRLTVDQVASTITVYPSLSGSIAEAARRMHVIDDEPSA
ncbi:NAD(P)H-quinone dehydrogenase [Gephyromycinifex aptenodytis]|uniref:NAD(P)H-quinone dehydrogenase n=1 Tax=Gephyromycinifex aptenodytis TaxID=2716227 RepID=UPI0014472708|nr:NAD(P)H-quinone dehydrogenase [Gephyromycinifex aptenodytis]